MAMFVLLLSLFVARSSWKRYRTLSKAASPLQKKLWEQTCVVSSSLAIALVFYHALLAVLTFGWQWITVHDLERMEAAFSGLKGWANAHKPGWGTWVFWSFTLYVTSAMWIRFLAKDAPFEATKKFKLWLQIVNTTIFFLAAFTVLGFDAGPPATTLTIHLQEIRKEHGLFQVQLRYAVVDSTINQVYRKAADAMPQPGKARELVDAAQSEGARLQEAVRQLPPRVRMSDPSLDRILRRIEARDRPFTDVHPEPNPTPAPDDEFWFIPLPSYTTYRKTLEAKERVRSFDEQVRPQLIRFLQRPGGKELVYELPKGAIDHLIKILDPITEAFPIFKPGVEVMKNMVNEALKQRLKAKIEQLVKDACKDPSSLDQALPTASREVTADAKPDVPPNIQQEYNREFAKLRHEITEVQHDIAKLETPRRSATPHPHRTERAETPRTHPSQEAREWRPDIPIRPPTPDVPIRPRAPDRYTDRPFEPTSSFGGGAGGGGGYTTYTTSCVCKTYINGALVSSVPIPVGARCGAQVCGRDMPAH